MQTTTWNIALSVSTALLIWWIQRTVSKFDGYEKRLNTLEIEVRQNILNDQNKINAIIEKMDLLFQHMKETLQRIEKEVENLRNRG